jgi:hypothetical protein
VASRQGRFMALGCIGLIFLLDTRSSLWLITVPLALGSAGFVAGLLAPSPARREVERPRASRRLAGSLLTGFAVAATILLLLLATRPLVERETATALSPDERAAMAWVAAATPPASRFLVVTGEGWARDRSSEWFPVLADRISLGTVQGTEWLPGREYALRQERYAMLQACRRRDTTCLDAWAHQASLTFSHVYLANGQDGCCAVLRTALESDQRYSRVYTAPDATIFARHE